jgi:hypothetical protein
MESESLQFQQFRRDVEIDSDASFQFWFQGDQIGGAVAAAEFQHLEVGSVSEAFANCPLRQPHSGPVNPGQPALPIAFMCPLTHYIKILC